MIYKICSRQLWQDALETGSFPGADIDRQDGFIHFSTAAQVHETAAKHFGGQADLLLLAVPEQKLRDRLKWEVSRGGALFPHLYGPLAVQEVVEVMELPLSESGIHEFPDLTNSD